jgi:pimeloyl-ACP methyl ester carboxylesterase
LRVRRETIQANGLTFSFLTEGTGPLLLLLHGFPQFSYAWRKQIPELAKSFRVVAPDLRGYNDSSKPPRVRDYSIAALASDVPALIAALGEKKAFVAGHDWGGGVAYAAAIQHPECVEKLVVLNCPHPGRFLKELGSNFAQLKRSWYMFFFQLPWLPERVLHDKGGELIPASSARPSVFTREDRDAYTEALRKPGAATGGLNYYRAAFRGFAEARAFFAEERKIAAPTLLIWGEKDHALGVELTEGMAPYFSGPLTVRRVPEASHWINEEQPELVNRLIAEFLRA